MRGLKGTGSRGGLGGSPGGIQEWVRAEGSDPSPSAGPEGRNPGAVGASPGAGRVPPRAERLLLPQGPAPASAHTSTHSLTHQHPRPPPVLPAPTAKMLLLLLGIIVLHVTVLVLLFVSTIVSVSMDFSPEPGYRQGRECLAWELWYGKSRRGYFYL